MSQAVYVETTDLPLDQLTPYPGNARRGDVPGILESLRRNAQYRALTVRKVSADGPYIVLAGNNTMAAFELHGTGPCDYAATGDGDERVCGICHGQPWTPAVRCELISCDEATAARINIGDNRYNDLAETDPQLLAEQLAALGGDLEGTGWTPQALDEFVNSLETPDPPDDFPEHDEDIETNTTCPRCGYEWSDSHK